MHGKVDATGGEGLFDFLGEHAFGADLSQSDVGDFVAGGVDDFDFHRMAALAEQGSDVVGLPEGKLGAARADAEMRHRLGLRHHNDKRPAVKNESRIPVTAATAVMETP